MFIRKCLLGYHKARQLARFWHGALVSNLDVLKRTQHNTIFCGGKSLTMRLYAGKLIVIMVPDNERAPISFHKSCSHAAFALSFSDR